HLVVSAHDCAEGGLAVALAESCIAGNLGATLKLDDVLRPDALLFGEAPSRIVVSFRPEREAEVRALAERCGAPMTLIGATGGRRLHIYQGAKQLIDAGVDELGGA